MEAFTKVENQYLNPNRPKPSLLQKVGLIYRVAGLTGLSLISNFFIVVCSIIFPILGRSRYRALLDYVQQSWFDMIFMMLKPTKMHLTGSLASNKPLNDPHRPRVIIANHITDVDWLYLWMLAHQCVPNSQSGHVKVMLKDGVKKIPIYGWMLNKLDFIWLKRDWESDRVQISKMIKKLAGDEDQPLWLILFPEGMSINTKSMEKSMAFAKLEKRPALEHTLLPRSRGLEAVLENLADKNPIIMDVTLGFESYSGEIPTWEMGYERNRDHLVPNVKKLFAGMAGDVFMDVQEFTRDEIIHFPHGGIQGWLDQRWERKDSILADFAKQKTLSTGKVHISRAKGSPYRFLKLLAIDYVIVQFVRYFILKRLLHLF